MANVELEIYWNKKLCRNKKNTRQSSEIVFIPHMAERHLVEAQQTVVVCDARGSRRVIVVVYVICDMTMATNIDRRSSSEEAIRFRR